MKKTLFTVIFCVFLLLGIAPAGHSEVGVTDTEIHIGQWSPQTGPAAAWGAVARGTDAYFKWINANGGIHGRKLVHHYFDDAYNPAKTIAGVKQLQEQTGMFAWASGVGTACGLAVKDYLMENKILWVGPSSGSRHWVTPPQKHLFNVYPLYLGDAQLLTEYAISEMDKKKLAVVYQEDDYGKQGLEGAEFVLKKHDMELAEAVPVSLSDTDMRPHAMKLRKADADAVLLFVTPGHVARLLGTAKAMNFEPQWMSTTTCGDFPLMMAITKGLYEGVITASFGMMNPTGRVGEVEDFQNPSHELMATYKKEVFNQFAAKDERWGMTFCAGIGFVEPLIEGIRRAGPDLTREKVVEEMEKMENFQGIMGRISYAPYNPEDPLCRIGQQEIFLQQCTKDGGAKILTEWQNTEFIPMSE